MAGGEVPMLYPETEGEWTQYRPPKRTAFGHQARRRDPMVAWRVTKAFLKKHCAFRASPDHVEVQVVNPGPFTTTPEAAATAQERIVARFGPPAAATDLNTRWTLDAPAVEEAIALCAEVNRRWPDGQLGPVTLTIHYLVAWRALMGRIAEGGYDLDIRSGCSRLGVGIWTRSLFLQPDFLFPLAWDSPKLAAVLSEIEPDCPFRFRDQYFHRLLPSKATGDLTRSRKLPKGWRSGHP